MLRNYFHFIVGFALAVMLVGFLHWLVFILLIFATRNNANTYKIEKPSPTFPEELRRKLSEPDALRKAETCEWFNELLASILRDHIGLDNLASNIKGKLNAIFVELQHDIKLVIDKLEVKSISLGHNMPKFTRIATRNYDIANNGDIILDADLVFDGNLQMEVIADLFFKKRVHITGTLESIAGRLIVEFSDTTVTLFFQEDPIINLRISMGLGNMSLERIGALMASKIKSAINKACVYPHVQAFYYQRQKHAGARGYTYKSKNQVHTAIRPGTLRLTLLGASNLENGVSSWRRRLRIVDPYCVVSLGTFKHKTKPCLKTNEPVWNDTVDIDLLHLQRRVMKQSLKKSEKPQRSANEGTFSTDGLNELSSTSSTPQASTLPVTKDFFSSKDQHLYIAVFDKRKGKCLGCASISLADLPKNVLKNETLSLIPQHNYSVPSEDMSADDLEEEVYSEGALLSTTEEKSPSTEETGVPSIGELRIEYLLVMPESSRSESVSSNASSSLNNSQLLSTTPNNGGGVSPRLTQRRSATGMSVDLEDNLKEIEAWNKLDEEEKNATRLADVDLQQYRRHARQKSKDVRGGGAAALPMEYMELEIVTKLLENELQCMIGLKKRQLEGKMTTEEATQLLAESQGRLDGYQKEEMQLKESLKALGWDDKSIATAKDTTTDNHSPLLPIDETDESSTATKSRNVAKSDDVNKMELEGAVVLPLSVSPKRRRLSLCQASGILTGSLHVTEEGLYFKYLQEKMVHLVAKQGVLILLNHGCVYCQLMTDRLLVFDNDKRAFAKQVIRLDDIRGIQFVTNENDDGDDGLTLILIHDKTVTFQGTFENLENWYRAISLNVWLYMCGMNYYNNNDASSSLDKLMHHGSHLRASASQELFFSQKKLEDTSIDECTAAIDYEDIIMISMYSPASSAVSSMKDLSTISDDSLKVTGTGICIQFKNAYGYPMEMKFLWAGDCNPADIERVCSSMYNQWKNTTPASSKKYEENELTRRGYLHHARRETKLWNIFKIPDIHQDAIQFKCSLWKETKTSSMGHLYVTDQYVCFYAKSLFSKTKSITATLSIRDVRAETLGVFPGITIVTDVTKLSFCEFDTLSVMEEAMGVIRDMVERARSLDGKPLETTVNL